MATAFQFFNTFRPKLDCIFAKSKSYRAFVDDTKVTEKINEKDIRINIIQSQAYESMSAFKTCFFLGI